LRITDDHLKHLDLHGYAVVPDFLTPAELKAGRANLSLHFPSPEELWATPRRYESIFEDPEHLQMEFPFAGAALNDTATHPELVSFVERALGETDILLTQSAIWAKYAGTGDFEQEMHLDYQGNTLVVPRDDGSFRQVNMILYYTDMTADLGPTCVVSKTKTRELGMWPPFRPKKDLPSCQRDDCRRACRSFHPAPCLAISQTRLRRLSLVESLRRKRCAGAIHRARHTTTT
jgi:hypothetical protein